MTRMDASASVAGTASTSSGTGRLQIAVAGAVSMAAFAAAVIAWGARRTDPS